jgi:uncharacterized protein
MRQVALFVAALFAAPWIVDWILGFLLPPPSGDLSSFLAGFVPSVWTPTAIALLFVGIADGAAGVRAELKARLSYRRGSGRWLIVAGVVPILAMLIAVFSARGAGDSAAFISANGIPSMIALQVITGAVGEEFGWRGFLLTRLSKQVGQMRAAWVMAMLWSLWHVPAWFDPALPHHTMPMIPTLSFIVFFGVFLAFVFNRAGESVLATIAAHLSLNIMTGFGGVQLSSTVFWGALAVIFGVLAVLITLGSRTRPLGQAAARYHPSPVEHSR